MDGLAQWFLQLKNKEGQTLLHTAVKVSSCRLYNIFIEELQLPVDIQDMNGDTPMHLAVGAGDVDMVKCLLQAKVKPNPLIRNNDSLRTLNLAVMTDHLEIVSLLIGKGGDSNLDVAMDRASPLQIGVKNGMHNIVRSLLESNADPDFVTNYEPTTALQFAIKAKSWDCVKLLLEHGADIDFGYNSTPLTFAAEEGDEELVQFLLQNGASPNESDACGLKPIDRAALNGHSSVVESLSRVSESVFTFFILSGIDFIKEATPEELHNRVQVVRRSACNYWMSLVDENYTSKNWSDALFYCNQALVADPSSYEAKKYRCLCWSKLEDYELTLKYAEEYFSNCTPITADSYFLRSVAYLYNKKFDKALSNLKKAQKLSPLSEEIEDFARTASEYITQHHGYFGDLALARKAAFIAENMAELRERTLS